MSTTTILTSVVPFALIAGALCALPVSLLLLKIYRGAVARGMRASAATAHPEPRTPASPAPHPPASTLRVVTLDRTPAPASAAASPEYQRAVRGRWEAAAIYVAAGAAFAGVMTTGSLLAYGDGFSLSRVLILSWAFAWPAVLTIIVVAAYDGQSRWRVLGGYFAGLFAIAAIVAARNTVAVSAGVPLYWLLLNTPATVLVLAFLTRRIRAVGPLVLAFMTAVALGSQVIVLAASNNARLGRAISDAGWELGLSAPAVIAGMIAVGMLSFAAIGWPVLKALGRRYERKKLSDQSIVVDTIWLMFGMEQSVGLAFQAPPWILTGLVAFAAYKTAAVLLFRRHQARRRSEAPKTLLLLRVFALGAKSERLFDRFRKHWQYAGDILMIAGPDLVTATVEPNEFLEFVSGRLSRQFVTGAPDLAARLAKIDRQPDPDGRYRISEFFCRSDTWQLTMARLAGSSSAVLMDLRGFSGANRGCIFELGQLLDSIDLAHVVFLVDATTDLPFLDRTLGGLWDVLRADSPNRRAAACSARLFPVASQSGEELRGLLGYLLAPSAAPAVAGVQ